LKSVVIDGEAAFLLTILMTLMYGMISNTQE